VVPSRESNPGLPYSKPMRYQLSHAAPFFKITHARKATAGKFWPETTDTAGKFRPSGLWRETFYIPLPEKVTPKNPGK
jgi:hypothetical protein